MTWRPGGAQRETALVTVTVRPENPDDADELAAIAALCAAAFDDARYGDLPAALRATDHARPDWCFVAVDDAVVVGHVMVGTTFLEPDDGTRVRVPYLSPLAVGPVKEISSASAPSNCAAALLVSSIRTSSLS